MSRKQKNLIAELFDLLTTVPWWIGVIVAAVFGITGLCLGIPSKDPIRTAMGGFGKILCFLFAGVCLLAAAVSAIKQLFRRNLLDRQEDLQSLRSLSWQEFEQLVGEAYRRQGYEVEETGGGGPDGGVDLVLRGHGETVLVQCKQWHVLQVGVDKVRELLGVLYAEGATRGILVTSGTFTNEARSFKVGKPLTLVDGLALGILVREVRSQPDRSALPTAQPFHCPTDKPPTCPTCGAPMTIRTAGKGPRAGTKFYGCTRFSTGCRGTRKISPMTNDH